MVLHIMGFQVSLFLPIKADVDVKTSELVVTLCMKNWPMTAADIVLTLCTEVSDTLLLSVL